MALLELLEDKTGSEDNTEDPRTTAYNLLPSKSKKKYEKEYNNFDSWRKTRNFDSINDDVMLAYFQELANLHTVSTLWTRYSMLKSTLNAYENVNISRFIKLTAYLKEKNRLFKPKKAKTLEKEHVERFLTEAPDITYLMMKVVLIMGIFGACRCEELTKLTVDDIEDKGSYLLVTLPDHKTNKVRRFTVLRDGYTVNILGIYKKYAALRPPNVGHRRFFLNYKKERCTIQPVGINTLSRVPKEVAMFLNLPEPEVYTGHCFRRSSATLGSELMNHKRGYGGWRPYRFDDECVEDSGFDFGRKVGGENSSRPGDVNMSVPEAVPSCSRNIEEPPSKRTAFQWTQIVEDEEERKEDLSDYYEPMISPAASDISFTSSTTPRGTNRRKKSPDDLKRQSTQVLHEVAAELKSLNRNVNVLISQNKQMMSEIKNTNNILLKISQSREVFPARENSNSVQKQLDLNTKTTDNQECNKFELRTDIKVEEVSDDDNDEKIDFENVLVKSEN